MGEYVRRRWAGRSGGLACGSDRPHVTIWSRDGGEGKPLTRTFYFDSLFTFGNVTYVALSYL